MQTFSAPAFAYIPPATRHNVSNTGKTPLEYVYVVAPTAASQFVARAGWVLRPDPASRAIHLPH
jgi:oxalate decarboxylase/phosphoglucose isomerase-like protein (cupin superfamily)